MSDLSNQLVVALSSRALFDFEEENRIFEQADDRAYMRLQSERMNVSANPGVAFPLVPAMIRCPDCAFTIRLSSMVSPFSEVCLHADAHLIVISSRWERTFFSRPTLVTSSRRFRQVIPLHMCILIRPNRLKTFPMNCG